MVSFYIHFDDLLAKKISKIAQKPDVFRVFGRSGGGIINPETAVIEKVTYEETIPAGVSVVLWVDYYAGHSLLMLPSEYQNIERLGVAA